MRWSDVFTLAIRRKRGSSRSKTVAADQMIWAGVYRDRKLIVISTVRLAYGYLAHFVVNSGARIGCHDWSLPGGHYVDLAVKAGSPISDKELRDIARLAATEENRPIRVRRSGELLSQSVTP
jgi:hypothetical protein